MHLPYELTNYPESELIALRRLAARNDPEIHLVLNLLLNAIREIENLQPSRSKGRRPAYGEKAGEAKIVDRILVWNREGVNPTAIARMLNDENVPTQTGKKWKPQTVRNVIDRGSSPSRPA